MSQAIFVKCFMVAIAVVMLGLGLSLSTGDFKRVLRHRKAVFTALSLQIVLLPLGCYVLALALKLPALYATGLMILSASPGGVTANLYTHLFRGEVAMSISLTAITTCTSILILPMIANGAIAMFAVSDKVVPIQIAKMMEVLVLVLLPTVLGMWMHEKWPFVSRQLERPVKVFGSMVLIVVVVLAVVSEWQALCTSFAEIGLGVLGFNLLGLLGGYYISKAVNLDKTEAIAICFQSCVRNTTIPLFVAIDILGNLELALPAAIYSVVMHGTAILFGRIALSKTSTVQFT